MSQKLVDKTQCYENTNFMSDIPNDFLEQTEQLISSQQAIVLPGGKTELASLLYKANQSKKQLRIKLGVDPTNIDLHLGHTVCFQLLKRFLELGHKPVLIIGGFTAAVGDPSGQNDARPPLNYEQVQANSKTYLIQIGKILDTNKIEIVNNYDWLSKLTSSDLVRLSHLVTVNQLIDKEAFGVRISSAQPLYLHEVLYPILQGYDSYFVKADIEIGGIDQTYNVLFGRRIQKHFGQNEQLVILLPLLIGLDGTKKMSKTFKNYIALNDEPNEIFGKSMSIPDELIIHYFSLATDMPTEDIKTYEQDLKNGKNPKDIKMTLAHKLVLQLYDKPIADNARENFIKQFKLNEIPENIEQFPLKESITITDLMCAAKMVPSKAEAKRLIQGGGVKLKSDKVNDPNYLVTQNDKNSVLQIGKRKFVRIV